MNYTEGYYYEYIKGGKNYVIRFVKKIGDYKYEYYDLLSAETKTEPFESNEVYKFNEKNEIEYSETIPFKKLEITVCRKLELKTGAKKGIFFKEFIDRLISDLNTSLELNLNRDSKYYFKGSILEDKEEVLVENNINDFFKKIGDIIGEPLSQKEKDEFLIEQFS